MIGLRLAGGLFSLVATEAQQAAKVARIGWLTPDRNHLREDGITHVPRPKCYRCPRTVPMCGPTTGCS